MNDGVLGRVCDGGVNEGRDCGSLEREPDGGVNDGRGCGVNEGPLGRVCDGGVNEGRDCGSRELDGGVSDGRGCGVNDGVLGRDCVGGVNEGLDDGSLERELDGGANDGREGMDGRLSGGVREGLVPGVKPGRELVGGVNDGRDGESSEREGSAGRTSGLVSGGREVGGIAEREPKGEGIAGRIVSSFLSFLRKVDPGMAGRSSSFVKGLTREEGDPRSETPGRWLPGSGSASGRPKPGREPDGGVPVRGGCSEVVIGVALRTSTGSARGVPSAVLREPGPLLRRSLLDKKRPNAGGGVVLVAITGRRSGSLLGSAGRVPGSPWLCQRLP